MGILYLSVRLKVNPRITPELKQKLVEMVADLLDIGCEGGLYETTLFYPQGRVAHHFVSVRKRKAK